MNKHKAYYDNLTELQKLWDEYDKKREFIGFAIRDLTECIRELNKKHRFKYNGKVYYVVIRPLKTRKSQMKQNGKYIFIIIDNSLSKIDRQRELHIILKRKKCLTWF